ncbi:MAG: GIY-YIG nuclease family protein [Actinomycetales bacterium]|nr:GIY-YIG nuclease family protein [Actinomycetales bacterium]
MAAEHHEVAEGEAHEQATAAVTAAGTLYVMRERDHLTGQQFDYYKIGIVRGEKDVADREKQHRTGNPRGIVTVREVPSSAVQRLETRLHNHFAARRVSSGEWFHFPESTVTELLAAVEEFAANVEGYAALVSVPQADIDWEAGTVPDDGSGSAIARKLMRREAELEVAKANLDAIAVAVRAVAKDDPSLQAMLKTSYVKATNNFSATEVSKRFKDLYEKFKTKVRETISFRVVLDDPELSADVEHIRTSQLISSESLETLDAYALHAEYLRIWGEKDRLSFEAEQLEKSLKLCVGSAAGIEGVAVWLRKESVAFDKEAFKATHPDIYEQCRVAKPAKTTVNVAEWASYAH